MNKNKRVIKTSLLIDRAGSALLGVSAGVLLAQVRQPPAVTQEVELIDAHIDP